MKAEPFVIERILNSPVSAVWQAITDKEKMREWYFDVDAFKPELGFEFRFSGTGAKGEQYLHICRVTAAIPLQKLAYTWKYDGYPGQSQVTFELFAEGDKTRLRLTHEGIETFAANGPDFAKSSFTQGWTGLIGKSLPAYLERTGATAKV